MEHFQHSVSKTSKKLLKKLKKLHKKLKKYYLSLFAIFFGLFIFSFGAYHYYSVRILSFTKAPPQVEVTKNRAEVPVRIAILDLKIDLPIVEGFIQNGIWQVSDTSATHLDSSARPGEGGNVVIYGHNLRVIFGSLPYISIGSKITITDGNGKEFNYEVTQKLVVNPDRVDLLYPTDHEELTIYTCTGLFDSQRFIIKAKPML